MKIILGLSIVVLLQVLLILSVVLYTSLTLAMNKPIQPLHTLALAFGVSITSAFISLTVLCVSVCHTKRTHSLPIASAVPWPQVPPPETRST